MVPLKLAGPPITTQEMQSDGRIRVEVTGTDDRPRYLYHDAMCVKRKEPALEQMHTKPTYRLFVDVDIAYQMFTAVFLAPGAKPKRKPKPFEQNNQSFAASGVWNRASCYPGR
jgi:hypothetical protein